MADMKAANATSLDQYKAMPGAVSDSLKLVTFAAPAYVSELRSSEPLVHISHDLFGFLIFNDFSSQLILYSFQRTISFRSKPAVGTS